MITRRDLLKGMMLSGGYCLLPFGTGWALAAPPTSQAATRKHFIMIFMRGAVDGLSIVTPYREPYYYQARSGIALPQPGQSDGLLDLDGMFDAAVAKPFAGLYSCQRFNRRNPFAFRSAGYHGNRDAEFGDGLGSLGFARLDEPAGANPAR